MRVLFVCTANICRSPSAEWLLRDSLSRIPELAARVEVRSAGTYALVGAPGCSVAPPLAEHWQQHRAAPVTRELLSWADLILPLSREHRFPLTELDPGSRERTFTLRQAGRSADWLVESGASVTARGLVAHLDSVRGQVPLDEPTHAAAPDARPARRWSVRRRPAPVAEPIHPDDVPDPHVLGTAWHPEAAAQIGHCVDALVAVLRVAQ